MGILSALYRSGLSIRRFLYEKGLKQRKTLPVKVISIGNLTLGGTGKTPAVIALVEEAKKRGFNPCILTRGYRGKAKGPCFIDRKQIPDPTIYGDEPLLMAERLKDVPIVKCGDRYKGGIFALNSLPLNLYSSLLFIIDDGFQHWKLHRDIDILLIDATDPFSNGRLFPEGRLREPLDSIKRTDIIVITRIDMVNKESTSMIIERIKQYNLNAHIYTASHKPIALLNVSGKMRDIGLLNGKDVYAFAGIANPFHFKSMLLSIGANVVRFKTFMDHYNYKQQDIDGIIKEANNLNIITTEKDMVKLKGFKLSENIYALRIDFLIGETFYNYIFGGYNVKNH